MSADLSVAIGGLTRKNPVLTASGTFGYGLADDDCEQLDAALRLVRGRPFLGVDPASYAWAEADAQTMISAIVDIAYDTATSLMNTGRHTAAQRLHFLPHRIGRLL